MGSTISLRAHGSDSVWVETRPCKTLKSHLVKGQFPESLLCKGASGTWLRDIHVHVYIYIYICIYIYILYIEHGPGSCEHRIQRSRTYRNDLWHVFSRMWRVAQAREVKLKKCSPIAIAGMKTTAMDVRAPGRRPIAHIYCCNGSIHTSKQLHTVVLIKGLIYDLRESAGIYTGNLKG